MKAYLDVLRLTRSGIWLCSGVVVKLSLPRFSSAVKKLCLFVKQSKMVWIIVIDLLDQKSWPRAQWQFAVSKIHWLYWLVSCYGARQSVVLDRKGKSREKPVTGCFFEVFFFVKIFRDWDFHLSRNCRREMVLTQILFDTESTAIFQKFGWLSSFLNDF